ncbi:MAG: hypothetical protein QOF69_3470 [Solirubrobacteraceae bacterium]|nr:hypothetical protein [Solirubrobacteraceae bacterium]
MPAAQQVALELVAQDEETSANRKPAALLVDQAQAQREREPAAAACR